jgi:flagellar motor switch protein FliN/FliY
MSSPADTATATDALMRLGASTAEAVAKALDAICPSSVERGDVTVVPGDESPFDGFAFEDGPAVAVSVHYVDGVTGGNVLLMTARGARAIAAAMGDSAVPDDAAEPTELELSAVAEAANQMFAAAASATGVVLSQVVEIAPPDTQVLDSAAAAREAFDATPHAVSATFRACGEPCRLVQLVPNAFVVRMTRALDELGSELPPAEPVAGPAGARSGDAPIPGRPSLAGIPVRVWAELGRTRMPSAQVVGMPPGAVVELNQAADEPIDLYVNGTRFATGRLMVVDGTDWAVRIETVLSSSNTSNESKLEVARWPASW